MTTQTEFIQSVMDGAIESQHRTGVPASVTIAQAILESGWGKSGLAKRANNFFGIKGNGPDGSVVMLTKEFRNGRWITENATFRKYNTPAESFIDHGNLFREHKRYAEAMKHTNDPDRFAEEIAKAGYATDPNYPRKLGQLMETYHLREIDKHASNNPLTP